MPKTKTIKAKKLTLTEQLNEAKKSANFWHNRHDEVVREREHIQSKFDAAIKSINWYRSIIETMARK